MPTRVVVHKVKFSPAEMAEEPAADYSHLKFKRRRKPNLVAIEPDLAIFFKDATAVNTALRKLMELRSVLPVSAKRKRSA